MAAKKTNIKRTPTKSKGKGKDKTPPNPEKSTTLGDIIKDSEQAVIVSVSKGKVEVTAIKAINYAYQAKALLREAIDNYNVKPIINGLNTNTRVLLAHITNLNNKITKIVPDELPKDVKV